MQLVNRLNIDKFHGRSGFLAKDVHSDRVTGTIGEREVLLKKGEEVCVYAPGSDHGVLVADLSGMKYYVGFVWLQEKPKGEPKDRAGKPRTAILHEQFHEQLAQVIEVFEHGAEKYPCPPLEDNWRNLDPMDYREAIQRHMNRIYAGEFFDKDTGKPHYIHIINDALMLAKIGEVPMPYLEADRVWCKACNRDGSCSGKEGCHDAAF